MQEENKHLHCYQMHEKTYCLYLQCYSFDLRYAEYYLKCQLVLTAQWETFTHAYKTRQSCQMSGGITLIE